jgi:purine-binding chemotaxis protein CheW
MTETDLHITDENREAVELIQLVSFSIGEEEFGVDITRVQEIIKRTDVTTVPNAPHFVEGVMNLRGRVIPVINLRARLGMERKEFDADTRIVVVELSEGTIGFIVDAVSEVLRIPADAIEPPPPVMGGVEGQYITAVVKLEETILVQLDLEKVFENKKKAAVR